MTSYASPPRRLSFTLIELLVVVSIIAVLSAMLLPALQGARERSKSVVCISNIRQSGMAMAMYADENDGYIEPMLSPASNYSWRIGHWNRQVYTNYINQRDESYNPDWQRGMVQYHGRYATLVALDLMTPEVAHCPADDVYAYGNYLEQWDLFRADPSRSDLDIRASYFYNPSKRARIFQRVKLEEFKDGEIVAMDMVMGNKAAPDQVKGRNAHGSISVWNLQRSDNSVESVISPEAMSTMISRSAAGEDTFEHSFIRGNPPTWYNTIYPALAGVKRP